MKKIIIILTFVLSFCYAEAQGSGFYPCPSELYFQWFHETGKAKKFKLKLVLYNESQNLNGFVLAISKSDSSMKWAVVDKENDTYFSTKGYGKNILARLEGKTDEEREDELEQYCDIRIYNRNEQLKIIELLKTRDCLFFPAGSAIEVGELAVDLSDCEDGLYTIGAPALPLEYSFSYTGGVEGTCSLTPDPIELVLYKKGDLVSIRPWFPLDDYDGVEEIEKSKAIAGVKYYNLAGVESSEPQPGVNIKVTTWSDGTRTSEKMVR